MSIATQRAGRSYPPSRLEALEPRIVMDAALLGPPVPYHAHLFDTVLAPSVPNVGAAPLGQPGPYHAHLFDTVLAPSIPNVGTALLGAPVPYHALLFDTVLAPPAGNTSASVPALIQLTAAPDVVADIAILSVLNTPQPSCVLAPPQVAESTPVVAPDVLATFPPIDKSPLPPALFGPNGATECSHG